MALSEFRVVDSSEITQLCDEIRSVADTPSVSFAWPEDQEYMLNEKVIKPDNVIPLIGGYCISLDTKSVSVISVPWYTKGLFKNGNKNLRTLRLPNLSTMCSYGLSGFYYITSCSLPKLTSVPNYGLHNCGAAESGMTFYAPHISYIGYNGFFENKICSPVILSELVSMETGAFESCTLPYWSAINYAGPITANCFAYANFTNPAYPPVTKKTGEYGISYCAFRGAKFAQSNITFNANAIGESAFQSASGNGNTNIYFPGNISQIDNRAFASLQGVTHLGGGTWNTEAALGDRIFEHVHNGMNVDFVCIQDAPLNGRLIGDMDQGDVLNYHQRTPLGGMWNDQGWYSRLFYIPPMSGKYYTLNYYVNDNVYAYCWQILQFQGVNVIRE